MPRVQGFLRCVAVMSLAFAFHSARANDDAGPKSINIYIGSGPGGGYDFYGRLAARHLGRHIPGAPTITPQNMPGAGSITAANYMYSVAPKDGSALGIVSPSLSLIEGLNSPGVRFQAASFNWIGRLSSIANVTMAWHTSSVRTLDDAKKREMLIGGISINSPLSMLPRALNDYAGTRFKLVPAMRTPMRRCSPWSEARSKARLFRGARSGRRRRAGSRTRHQHHRAIRADAPSAIARCADCAGRCERRT